MLAGGIRRARASLQRASIPQITEPSSEFVMQSQCARCDLACIVVARAAKRCDQAAFVARRLLESEIIFDREKQTSQFAFGHIVRRNSEEIKPSCSEPFLHAASIGR
jgi:hypothetical protein